MANLQQYKDALETAEALEIEVTNLEKRKKTLLQDCTTLEAKKTFLTSEVATLQVDVDERKARLEQFEANADATVVRLTGEANRLQKLIDSLQQRVSAAETDLQTVHTTREADLARIRIEMQTIADERNALIRQRDDVRDDLAAVTEEIITSKAAAAVLDDQVRKRAAEVSAELERIEVQFVCDKAGFEEKLHTIQSNIAVAEQNYDQAQVKLVNAKAQTQQLADYKEYEKRAQKALDSRESSLIERENRLVDAEKRASRKGILDNV